MNKLLNGYELGGRLRYGCCLIRLYLHLERMAKKGFCAPADTRARCNAALGAQSLSVSSCVYPVESLCPPLWGIESPLTH